MAQYATMGANRLNRMKDPYENEMEAAVDSLVDDTVFLDDREASWAERFVGRIDPHSQYKGWHAAARAAASGLFIAMWILSICFVVHGTGVTYLTKFDLHTTFLTEKLVGPGNVQQQINLGHDQHFTVAGYLLTLMTCQIAVGVFAYLVSLISVWNRKYWYPHSDYEKQVRETPGGFFETFLIGSQWLFSQPSNTNTSMWINTEDIVVTPWLWVGFMMLFGVRDIWFLVTVGILGVARGCLFFAADADNAYSPEEIRSRQMEYSESKSPFSPTWRILRNLRASGFLGAFGITIGGWLVLSMYAYKFPYTPYPAPFLALFIVTFILEVLHTVVVPSIYYGIITRWGRMDARGDGWLAMDTDRYNIVRLFLYTARLAIFFFIVRWGHTGYDYQPQWGFV